MLQITKCAPQLAIKDGLNKAFQNFFRDLKKGQNIGYPKFKKKGINDSFSLSNDQFKIDGSKIKIPNLGWVSMREKLRYDGKIMCATVSRKADRWFVSVQVEMQDPMPIHTTISENQAVGVDLGVKDLVTLSNGIKLQAQNHTRLYCHEYAVLINHFRGNKEQRKAKKIKEFQKDANEAS